MGFLDGGTPSSYTQAFSDSNQTLRFNNIYSAVYVQDEWLAAPDLTVVVGLRYERQDHDDPRRVNPLYPLTGRIPDDTDNWAPRAGFAWDIGGRGASVLRGAVGVFYDATPTVLDANAMLTNGIRVVRYSVRCREHPGVCPTWPDTWSSPDDLGDAARPDIFAFDPDFENPETLRLSLGYEREVARNLSIGIDAIWRDTRKLERKHDQNLRPDGGTTADGRPTYVHGDVLPDFGRVIHFVSDADQEYRAIILTTRKRFAGRWFLDASYTWATSKDHDSNERSVSTSRDFPQDQLDLSHSWGWSNFDVRHKLVGAFGWQLPFNLLASGVVTWRSGFPYSGEDPRDNNGDGYRNEYAVIEVAPGVFEQLERNSFRQPDFTTFDFRLSWTASIGRQLQLELIGEVFNLFDASNWLTDSFGYLVFDDELGAVVPNPEFGRNTIPGEPRTFQVGARLRF